jgi:hypothetical protein
MMSATRLRGVQRLSRQLALPQRSFATTARQFEAGGAVPAKKTETAPQAAETPAKTDVAKQAPNRAEIWAPSQRPRSQAMTGPRFEQTDFDLQVRGKTTPHATEPADTQRCCEERRRELEANLMVFFPAATIRSDRTHPQAASSVDSRPGGGV